MYQMIKGGLYVSENERGLSMSEDERGGLCPKMKGKLSVSEDERKALRIRR